MAAAAHETGEHSMHAFDEMFEALADAVVNPRGYEAGRDVRAHYQAYAQWLATQSGEVMTARREEAEMIFRPGPWASHQAGNSRLA